MQISLFFKIFASFWAITILILATWIISAEQLSRFPSDLADRAKRGPPYGALMRLRHRLERGNISKLHNAGVRYARRYGKRLYLLDEQGDDLLGKQVEQDVREAANKLSPRQHRPTRPQGPSRLIAMWVYRSDSPPLRAVVELPSREPLSSRLQYSVPLRLLLAIVISGICCYLLSLMFTRRLTTIKNASTQFAAGNLTARVPALASGGDETDELARHFNAMADEIARQLETKTRLLRDVSHELRSPLSRLRIALALAEETAGDRGQYFRSIEKNIEQLEHLIDQLLASQLPAPPFDDYVELGDLINTLIDTIKIEAEPRHRIVNHTTTSTDVLVKSHGDLLYTALENILRNAIIHTPSGTRIEITLTAEPEVVRIVIADNGPGVPEAALGGLFDPLFRVDAARTPATAGYGLGLSIAKAAIEQHQGSITARNKHPGLAFEIRLPRLPTLV